MRFTNSIKITQVMCASLDFTRIKKCRRHFYVEMMGLIGAGNNPMVGITARCAVAVEEASK